jgi:predicted pyridoxine 5'-phosphate oxidase superfamily flavin-nucleotide-binding protein
MTMTSVMRSVPAPALSTPSVRIENITPEDAQQLLDHPQNRNRRLNDAAVTRIANEIDNGTYRLNGEAIIIGRDGQVLDAQHRLAAVVRAGKTIESVVVRGVDPAYMASIDSGRSRSAGDYLAISGIENYNSVAAAVNALAFYKVQSYAGLGSRAAGAVMRSFSQGVRLTPQQVAEALRHNSGIIESVSKARGYPNIKRFPTTAAATVHYLAYYVAGKRLSANRWLASLMTGTELVATSPILQVRNALIDGRVKTAGRQLYQLVRSFNWEEEGRVVSKLTRVDAPVALSGAEPSQIRVD